MSAEPQNPNTGTAASAVRRGEPQRRSPRRLEIARRRLVARAHGIVGALAAIPLLLIGLSGTALVFSEDMLSVGTGAAGAPGRALSADEAGLALERALEALEDPEGGVPTAVSTLRLPRADFGLARAWLADGTQALVDVNEGQVVSRFAWFEHPATLLHELHVSLALGDVGEQIVGGVGLVSCALLLSGGFALWRRRATLVDPALWRPRSTRRGELTRAHGHWGLALLPLMLVALLTGLGLTYHGTARALLTALAGGDSTAPSPPAATACSATESAASPSAMAALAGARFPDAELVMVYPPRRPQDPWGFRMRQSGEWHPNGRSMVWVDACSGRVLGSSDAQAAALGDRLVHALYPLHAARFPGRIDDAVVALTGVGLVLVVSAGAAGRLRAHARRRSRPSVD